MSVLPGRAAVQIPFSGTTDANGNFTSPLSPLRIAYWCSVKLVAATTGSGTLWAVTASGGADQDYGNGGRVSMGPFLVAPGEQLQIKVQGAVPNVQVAGEFIGVQGATIEDVLGFYSLTSNPLSVQTSAPQQHLATYTFSTAGGTVTNTTPTLPSGCHLIGIGVAHTLPVSSIKVSGHTTGIVYNSFAGSITGLLLVLVLSPEDTTLDIQLIWNAGTPSPILYVDAVFDTEAVNVIQEQTFTVAFDSTSNPPPWLAARNAPQNFNINLNAAGIVHVIPVASVGAAQHVYLFAINETPTGAAAAGNWQDTAGTVIDNESFATPNSPRNRLYYGSPLAAGLGLDFNVTVTTATFLVGSVAYSIF